MFVIQMFLLFSIQIPNVFKITLKFINNSIEQRKKQRPLGLFIYKNQRLFYALFCTINNCLPPSFEFTRVTGVVYWSLSMQNNLAFWVLEKISCKKDLEVEVSWFKYFEECQKKHSASKPDQYVQKRPPVPYFTHIGLFKCGYNIDT